MRLDVRRRLPLLAITLTAAVAFPLGVIASHQFTDVPTSSTFHADIDAIRDAGVTTGCGLNLYCPKDFVTREQMAAFLNRLGALQAGKTPVVNADKVDGVDEVLGAGDIVNIQQGPWFPGGASPVTTMHYFDVDTVMKATAGMGVVVLTLDGPTSIDGRTYGLASLNICHSDSVGVTITESSIWQSTAPDNATSVLIDPTDRPLITKACFLLTDPTPNIKAGGMHLALNLSFASDNGLITLGNVTSTWTPTTTPLE